MLQQQVLAWETTPDGFSFQYTSDGTIILETDNYRASATIQANNTLPGRVAIPLAENIDTLKRFIQKVEAIQGGELVQAPTLSIAS